MHSHHRKVTYLKRVNPWKYPQNDNCIKLNLVQVHISNSFQCIGKHKLFKITNAQFISVIS